MSNQTDGSAINIETKLAEAELYAKHGLLDNAHEVYDALIRHLGGADHPLRARVEEGLQALSPKEKSITKAPSDKKGPLSKKESLERYENCVGLMEAGFYSEAEGQLKSLLDSGYRPGAVQSKIGECCLRLSQPFEALEFLEAAIKAPDLADSDERLDILDRLATTYETIGATASAIKTLEHLVQINSGFRNAFSRLKRLSKTAQKFGRFYFLIKENLLSEDKLERAKESAKQKNKTIDHVLMEEFGIQKAQLGKALSEHYGCKFLEYNEKELGEAPDVIKDIKEMFFRRNVFIPIQTQDGRLVVATDNPHDMVKLDNIRSVCKGQEFHFAVALAEDINKYIDHFFGKYFASEDHADLFEQLELVEVDESDDQYGDEPGAAADGVVVQMTNKIIEDAVVRRASDIHIEGLPGKRGTSIRFRIDGECSHYQNIPFLYKRSLVSRLKILAKLDISERRMPQDGKIKFKTRQRQTIELRVATVPTVGGNEDVVLRVLTSGSQALPIDRVDLQEHNLVAIKQLLDQPYGLILCCGPTGSGKTTTLHAALNYINTPEKKIWTVEDPVEIMQDGLRQVQVEPKIDLDFARVLKAFLRADPDVIMVGETRDEETAHTVIVASLTGHLVLSTLHTNSAPETVTRLLGMGMDPLNFADALLGVLSQRLVRRICPHCKEPFTTDDETRDIMIKIYGDHPVWPVPIKGDQTLTLYRGQGCPQCNNSGLRGRCALHELLVNNDELKRLIEGNSSVADIREACKRAGMQTLLQDGIVKILAGATDLHHVRTTCIR